MGAFHAYDIRGVYGVDLTDALAYKIGYFIPRLLGADKVLVGRDCRVSSEAVRDSLVQGILDTGSDVWDIGLSSTPMVYFGTARHGFKASVQITASHNPAQYNGMKVSREDALPVGLESGLGQIRDWIEAGEPTTVAERRGELHRIDILDEYLEYMRQFKGDYSNLKITFDLSNGMSNLFAKQVYGDGPEYIFDTIDGRFPNHDPNPLVAKNVEPLMEKVRSSGADIGLIFDGDADRVMFVDDKARFVSPDLVIALMAIYFCDMKGAKHPRVLQEIRSSKSVGEFLERYGAELHTWKVGRAFAAPKLREIDGLWGGELAGHYYYKDFFYSDSGLLSSMIVLNIVSELKKRGISLSEQIDSMNSYHNSGEINFHVEDKAAAMEAVREHFAAKQKPLRTMDFDGYRLEFDGWWFNVRPSNTEPYLRFICEAHSEDTLKSIIAETEALLKDRFGAERS